MVSPKCILGGYTPHQHVPHRYEFHPLFMEGEGMDGGREGGSGTVGGELTLHPWRTWPRVTEALMVCCWSGLVTSNWGGTHQHSRRGSLAQDLHGSLRKA